MSTTYTLPIDCSGCCDTPPPACKWYCVQLWEAERHFTYPGCVPMDNVSAAPVGATNITQCMTDAEAAAVMATPWAFQPFSGGVLGADCEDESPVDCFYECYWTKYFIELCADPMDDYTCDCEHNTPEPTEEDLDNADFPCCADLFTGS